MQVTDNSDQEESDHVNSQVQVTDNSDQQETEHVNSQVQVTDNSDQQETDHVNSQVQVTDNSDQQETDHVNSQVQATDNSKQPQMNTYNSEVQVTVDSKQQKLPKLQVLELHLCEMQKTVVCRIKQMLYFLLHLLLMTVNSVHNSIRWSQEIILLVLPLTDSNQPKYPDHTLTPVQELDQIMQPKHKKSKHMFLHVTDKESNRCCIFYYTCY